MIAVLADTQERLEQCLAVRSKVFVDEQQVPLDLEIDGYDASPEACRHWLVLDGSEPAAAGRWIPYGDGQAKLQRIAVYKHYRGQGLGMLLVEAMERDAAERGCAESILDAQVQAEPFYKKLGYRTISEETFLDAGIEHVRMSKRIG